MQSQRGDLRLWRPRFHSGVASHKARRGDHLRLRERLSQVCDRAFTLSVQTLPEAARPQTERGARHQETAYRKTRTDAAPETLIIHGMASVAQPRHSLLALPTTLWPC